MACPGVVEHGGGDVAWLEGGDGHPRQSARLRRGHDPRGADRITTLHDDLLLHMLAHLGCAATAVRMSLLSRRWRGLWTRLPELVLREVTPELTPTAVPPCVASLSPTCFLTPSPSTCVASRSPTCFLTPSPSTCLCSRS